MNNLPRRRRARTFIAIQTLALLFGLSIDIVDIAIFNTHPLRAEPKVSIAINFHRDAECDR